ncbi:metallophosphoesterase family protein [Virgibacillus salexigens]|uniref:Serine/threonine-protein phosphatase 1 n=1 Tax=Virgibacillus massiliensis TaxID=1462526 RepID=A0A024QH15_9BACI|nr:metallophosphoesterase family protein [Virgibacillus massiliensis]CDQ41858.1 Serine/threonine-protein phosphatase 1 [Virgibacillus massiliensis]
MKRILAISDIHGCLDELNAILDQVNYCPEKDRLVLVGDYVDRGLKSRQVIERVMDLQEHGAIVLRGNHDQMFINWLIKHNIIDQELYLSNGGIHTIESYVGYDFFEDGIINDKLQEAKQIIYTHYRDHITFLYHLPYYYEIKDHVFVHAGIDPLHVDWKSTSLEDMLWIRKDFLDQPHLHDVTFVHGHTPCFTAHDSHDIYFDDKKIGIDGACAYGGQLNCLEINDSSYEMHYVKRNEIPSKL